MTDFLSDDEKADAIKAWLKENGTSMIVGVSLAVTGLLAYRYWQEHTVTQAQQASSLYSSMQINSVKPDDKMNTTLQTLKAEHDSTPYATLATLLAAKQQALIGNNPAAIQELQWAVDHSPEKLTQDLAKLRLARVYIANKQLDKARVLLKQPFPAAYASLIAELQGDIYLADKQLDKARAAYDKALLSAQGIATDYLKMKRDDLGKAIGS
jgi:predicted negative regulator of RcsB-dependent stress response